MPNGETPGAGEVESIVDSFSRIGVSADQLDDVEVEGGLTWRQAMILALTQCYLRIPGDETATDQTDVRLKIRQSVDSVLRARLAENGQFETAKDTVVYCLEVASAEYAKLCEVLPEWANDKSLVDDLLLLWRKSNVPYLTEDFARNVLHYMFNRNPST